MSNKLTQLLRRQQHNPAESRIQPERKRAPAKTRGNRNRRLITVDKAVVAWNMFTPTTASVLNGTAKVKRLLFKERQYHLTKGYRVRGQ